MNVPCSSLAVCLCPLFMYRTCICVAFFRSSSLSPALANVCRYVHMHMQWSSVRYYGTPNAERRPNAAAEAVAKHTRRANGIFRTRAYRLALHVCCYIVCACVCLFVPVVLYPTLPWPHVGWGWRSRWWCFSVAKSRLVNMLLNAGPKTVDERANIQRMSGCHYVCA